MKHQIHVWDCGLLCKFFYVPGGREWAGHRFAKSVRKHSLGAGQVVLCTDVRGVPNWRHAIYPQYKAGRPDKDEDEIALLDAAYETLFDFCSDFCSVLKAPGFEADDLVATVATRAVAEEMDVVVFSHDKDMAQLMGDGVRLHDGKTYVTEQKVIDRFGVPPEQVGDYLSIAGDACDGIPGVFGIGPAGAVELLKKYGTLQGALDGVPKESKLTFVEKRLMAAADRAVLSRKLVDLRFDVPIKMPWER